MHKNFLIQIFTLLLFTSNAVAQRVNEKQIDSTLASVTGATEPGFVAAIIKSNKLVYAKGFGLADIEKQIKIDVKTPFNIASNSKQFTVACIYLLEQQGKLKTSDKLSRYFKDLPKYADSITIAHLIYHQSGLKDYSTLRALRNIGDFKRERNMYQLLAAQKSLNFKPGEETSYSNSGYFYLSLIVKQLSGMDLADFAKQNIFTPLKMTSTSFSRNHRIPHKANGYVFKDNQYLINNATDTTIGQGNMYSNVPDLKKWLNEIKTHKHFGEALWQKMFTPPQPGAKYAGGLIIDVVKGRKRISHGGDIDGYHSDMYSFPNDDLGMIILSNKDNISISGIHAKLIEAVYGKETPAVVNTKTEEKKTSTPSITFDTTSYIGTYRMSPGTVFDVSKTNKELSVYQRWNGMSFKLLPKTQHLFYTDFDPNVTFEFKNISNDKAQELELFQEGKVTKITRTEIDINLTEYTGQFYNDELETSYTFIIKDGVLEFSSNKEPVQLTATDKDHFYSDWGDIIFSRDKEGSINGFSLNHTRVKNLHFTKTIL
ncbi:serine hydrolase [Pedobacter nyackensis]|uniref:serine hydrolase n=1 Tax=Pedobacter nyackensis TaxID=475255 RepID=UPI0029301C7A|nr:serine hydrolase [Pedobacter nyackensis]